MLDRIKTALRISHDLLDSEIKNTIETARAEMVRSGISIRKAYDVDDFLIEKAITTYCKAEHANDSKMVEKYEASWNYQIDNLRKTEGYSEKRKWFGCSTAL